ncbi:hypothetical protein VB796_08005 [Arcicella sp. LKC2W]|uniref:hypothetical protein n=1 Tax=Arcicella sp. LKC2W TaxID=2984198 RepID=UPI002B1FEC0E|nr:hypothetical protein [Arcicella sp. LKC2W]MEA5458976.1 hypothetical protein [Arcicella sp. LKC2W]
MKAISLLLSIVFVITIAYACQNPLEGVVIKTKDALATSAIKIHYYNANVTDPERIPKDLKVSIVGTDADKVVNSVGGKKITCSKEGILGIAISPDYLTRPLKFSVVVEAEGYIESIKSFYIIDQRNYDINMPLFKTNNLPNGLESTENQSNTTSNGNISAFSVNLKGKSENLSLAIQEGVNLKDEFNQPVTGKITTILTYFEGNAKSYVPNAYTVYNAIDLNGKTLKPFDFHNFCFFQTELFNEQYQKVDSFSEPIDITVEINGNNIHTSGEKLKVGDKIMFWGYIGGVWTQLGEYVLKLNNRGKLEVSVKISKSGYYTFGEMYQVCEKAPTIVINSQFSNADIYYFAKLIEATKRTEVGAFYLNINNGAKTSLAGRRPNHVYLQIFDYNSEYGGDLAKPIYQSAPFDLCTEQQINVNITIPQPQPITLELVVNCPDGKLLNEADFPAEMYSQYRLSNSALNSWKDLFKLTRNNRKLTTNKLQLGKRYILRSTTNPAQGWPFLQKDTTILQSHYLIKLNGEQYCK